MKKYLIEKTVCTQAHTQALRKALATVLEIKNELVQVNYITGVGLPHTWDSVVNGEIMTDLAWDIAMTTDAADVTSRLMTPQTRHGICQTAGYLAGYYNILELLMKSFGSQYEAELHYFNYAVELLENEIENETESNS